MRPVDDEDRVRSSLAYSFQCDLAVIEIKKETGQVHVERYITVHDVGNMLNPAMVDGQILGGFAHGLGAAMTERVKYDNDGNLLTATFQDYMCPTAPEIPHLEIEHLCSPSPNTLLGSKGLGDGSSMISPVVMANAIADAIGVQDLVPPFTPSRVWSMLNKQDPEPKVQPRREGQTELRGHPLSGEGSVVLKAVREVVWRLLVDPRQLASVIPGCKEIKEVAPQIFLADIDIRVAGIGGAYRTDLSLHDLKLNEALRLDGKAEGKLGTGMGIVHVRLSDEEYGHTRLTYEYRAAVSGKVAGFGHRMLDSVTKVLISSFFQSLDATLTGKKMSPLGQILFRLRMLVKAMRS
jgi:2-furoyl-CoA dehydrogenase large subunit